MATQTYKVSSGDTLGKIAKQFGVRTNDITGYRSNNPNLIYPGEELTIGSSATPAATPAATTPPPGATAREGSIRTNDQTGVREMYDPGGEWVPVSERGGEQFQLSSGAEDLDYTKAIKDGLKEDGDPFSVDSYKSKATTAATNRENSFNQLKDLQTRTYDEQYKEYDMPGKKENITKLDNEIADLREKRDTDILQVRSNSGLSASQMVGDIKKQADYYNDLINTKINQRNGIASEYNSALGEINNYVGRVAADKKAEYDYYTNLEKQAYDYIDRYNKALRDQLEAQDEQERWEEELAQDLYIAQMNAANRSSGSGQRLQAISNDFGEIQSIFNPYTGQVIPVASDLAPADEVRSEGKAPGEPAREGLIQRAFRGLFG